MARIIWKGEGASPPPSLEWRGITFPLGQAVEVDDPAIVAKAKTAPAIFKVEEEPAKAGPQPRPAPKPAPQPAPPTQPEPDDDEDDDDEEEEDKPHPTTRAVHHRAPSRKKK